MSNVLIGIIGVILFIGLALAGAYFLGVQFSQSTYQSKAAAVSQGLGQVVNAARMKQIETQVLIPAGSDITAELAGAQGYLKSVPANPTGVGAARIVTGAGADVGPAEFAVMPLVSSQAQICRVIAKNSKQTLEADGNATILTAGPLPTQFEAGCYNLTGAIGTMTVGHWVIQKI